MKKQLYKYAPLLRACLKRTLQGPNPGHLGPTQRRSQRSWDRGVGSRGQMQEQNENLGQARLTGKVRRRDRKGSGEYGDSALCTRVQEKGNKLSICPTRPAFSPVEPGTSLMHPWQDYLLPPSEGMHVEGHVFTSILPGHKQSQVLCR